MSRNREGNRGRKRKGEGGASCFSIISFLIIFLFFLFSPFLFFFSFLFLPFRLAKEDLEKARQTREKLNSARQAAQQEVSEGGIGKSEECRRRGERGRGRER